MRNQAERSRVVNVAGCELVDSVLDDLRTVLQENPGRCGVDASGATVAGALSWPKFNIGGVCRFTDATFLAPPNFERCNFGDDADFTSAFFKAAPNFEEA